ncbi:BREX-3 system P-loop-containing protein BrxF [Pueribacillus theae]|uniref:BREX-3 system P-loop-containing protein BrxF n=1 Tax=Pueribacillus theae TaxID=2171751 RepID=A0A2U1JSH8_9BACI|nr:BREX-3 system P-loop-containing protein BrxF [Pueribacillus theae]PWA07894.1 BREX-3 system P-loop-containing protein BrxF [Pueribacillus theae]
MNIHSLKKDINQFDAWYHKLIFLVDVNEKIKTEIPLLDRYERINVNRVVSEGLLSIPKQRYPMYVEELLKQVFKDIERIYLLQHIDILFDQALQIHPIRLLENLSKTYKLIVEWPGRYVGSQLIYAEHEHPEYFVCGDFEGKVYIK